MSTKSYSRLFKCFARQCVSLIPNFLNQSLTPFTNSLTRIIPWQSGAAHARFGRRTSCGVEIQVWPPRNENPQIVPGRTNPSRQYSCRRQIPMRRIVRHYTFCAGDAERIQRPWRRCNQIISGILYVTGKTAHRYMGKTAQRSCLVGSCSGLQRRHCCNHCCNHRYIEGHSQHLQRDVTNNGHKWSQVSHFFCINIHRRDNILHLNPWKSSTTIPSMMSCSKRDNFGILQYI